MNTISRILKSSLFVALVLVLATGCKKLARPALGDYPADSNPPGGPLKFYTAFDGTTTNAQMNAVDSIRANFPSDNPLASIAGISGKAVQGDAAKFIKYSGVNDFPANASSFSISFWEKRNGIPNGNASFVFTIPSGNKQWGSYGFSMFLLFDWGTWTPTSSAIVKFYMVDDNCKCDTWITWEGGNKVPNVQDNNWHHMVLVYDATTSKMTLYVDGVANPNVGGWSGHGAEKINASNVQGLDLGGNRNIKDMGWGMNWDGGLDQFRLYGKALSAAEVTALYTGKQ
ncbi:MAG: LamG domain-containing protein [Bacteroidetes bacterium]|nr:LamG domain-containing protein [Bacteroidota bacterium]